MDHFTKQGYDGYHNHVHLNDCPYGNSVWDIKVIAWKKGWWKALAEEQKRHILEAGY